MKKSEALFVPDGVELKNLSYRYVVLTKDNASEEELKGAIETTDGRLIALVSWDVSADETTDKKGRKIETCDLSKLAKDGTLTLHAQWREASSDDETLTGADYAQSDDIEAVDVQGEAAKSREAARKELVAATSVSSTAARSMAAELCDGAAGDGEGEEPTDPTEGEQTDPSTPPRSGDGTNIEQLTAKWITADTVNNDDLGLLYIKPGGDSTQSVRLQINYALSGEHNSGPGDVTITMPAHIFTDRNGKDVGTLAIPYPKEPSTKNDFNWKLVGDNYVLTNTKRMSAATKGYIQFAISGLVPHTLVDMEISDEFTAYIEVITHKDNTIALRSNPLTAQFDTEARLSSVSKRAYGAPSRVPARSIPASQRIEGEDEYILVNWYVWAYTSANQPYTLSQVDTLPGDKVVMQNDDGTMTEIDAQGFILNATSEDGRELARGASGTSYSTGTTSYYYYSTAYPASQFEPDVNYTFHNDINMTLTEVDP
ncbi:MAG: hypothetical protein IJ092_05230, partial [Atopobiaceae bacterium]|nr:hypothetical protein [Atopobiaceae bacterium]